MGQVEHSTRILRSSHSIKLGNLFDSRIKIGRINSIELKLNSTITLIVVCSSKIARFTKITMIAKITKTTKTTKTSIVAKKCLNQERENNF